MILNKKKNNVKTCKFYTFGCKVNQYETQLIREQFLAKGFIETNKNPDYFIINGCTVTAAADRKCRYLLRSLHKKNPSAQIIVTGCFAKNNPDIIFQPGVDQVIPQEDKLTIIEQINLNPEKKQSLIASKLNAVNLNGCEQKNLINDFKGHSRAFVKIQDGCDNFCTYCIIPSMRGLPISRDLEIIKQEVAGLAKKGFKEIVLTGINLGMWSAQSPKTNNRLSYLIEQLLTIKQLQRLRLSSVELIHVDDLLIKQIENSDKLCAHLHIPLQSGDDQILKKMNRRYTRDLFLRQIKKIKHQVSDICFTTDIMVGFPGESEENFKNTLDFVKKAGFLKVHVFPYSPRPGTKAATMPDQIDPKVKDLRKKKLVDLANLTSFELRKKLINKKTFVLFEESSYDGCWMGYADNYVQIKVKSAKNLKNFKLPVIISNVTHEQTIAELVE
ncbi:MAG: tRNA (N(6)-L-threonylcarbamoyladenosine(37)-C(2))-methylthiotransferase MtaB [Candidatus Omnitrophica bacterium]|nr:tRNA (N(6)-L-threonylcarbamoyladenosine(37)-C(2))-methylthiotransferase MtaB [Candidatus Omnitrophota bacterium]